MTSYDHLRLVHALAQAASVADTVSPAYLPTQAGGVRLAIDYIMATLASDNPDFDAKQFYDACYADVNRRRGI